MTTGPDLILGVSRAADTVKQQEARARLEHLSRQASSVADTGAPPAPAPADAWLTELRVASADTSRPARVTSPSDPSNPADKKSEVYTQFEAVLLQNMIETMMPKDSEAMFGSGTAGQIWKSMLSEKVAAEIARSGALGIAKEIEKGPHASSAIAPATQSKVDDT